MLPDQTGFLLRQLLLLSGLALLLWLTFHFTALDAWFAGLYFDSDSHSFPLKDALWLEWLNHRLAKYLIIGFAVISSVRAAYRRDRLLARSVAALACATLAVSLLKAHSAHSCPWDLAAYGGHALPFELFSPASVKPGPGRCFPGGHAAAGFALMAMAFAAPTRQQARLWLAGGFACGLLMGWGQLMRGAHFLSHNLWSAWLCWAVIVLVMALWPQRESVTQAGQRERAAGSGPIDKMTARDAVAVTRQKRRHAMAIPPRPFALPRHRSKLRAH